MGFEFAAHSGTKITKPHYADAFFETCNMFCEK